MRNKICLPKKLSLFVLFGFSILLFIIFSRLILRNKQVTSSRAAQVINNTDRSHDAKNMIRKKVLVLIIDPLLSSFQRQIEESYSGTTGYRFSKFITKEKGLVWNDPEKLTQDIIYTFQQASSGRIQYQVQGNFRMVDHFLNKENATKITLSNALKCLEEKDQKSVFFLSTCQNGINYNDLINEFKICDLANKGEIDEVWIWGYAWTGFFESRMAGTNAYNINSTSPVLNTNCNRMIPFMGFSLERDLGEALHDFGHRMEATMAKVYHTEDPWKQNVLNNRWDKFKLSKSQSLNFTFGGLGSIHFPALNGYEYDYSANKDTQQIVPIKSIYPQFEDYEKFTSSNFLTKKILQSDYKIINSCKDWGSSECREDEFIRWWFSKLPHFTGIGLDGVLNDWWAYFIEPKLALQYKDTGGLINSDRDKCRNKPNALWLVQCSTCATLKDTTNTICITPIPPSPTVTPFLSNSCVNQSSLSRAQTFPIVDSIDNIPINNDYFVYDKCVYDAKTKQKTGHKCYIGGGYAMIDPARQNPTGAEPCYIPVLSDCLFNNEAIGKNRAKKCTTTDKPPQEITYNWTYDSPNGKTYKCKCTNQSKDPMLVPITPTKSPQIRRR